MFVDGLTRLFKTDIIDLLSAQTDTHYNVLRDQRGPHENDHMRGIHPFPASPEAAVTVPACMHR